MQHKLSTKKYQKIQRVFFARIDHKIQRVFFAAAAVPKMDATETIDQKIQRVFFARIDQKIQRVFFAQKRTLPPPPGIPPWYTLLNFSQFVRKKPPAENKQWRPRGPRGRHLSARQMAPRRVRRGRPRLNTVPQKGYAADPAARLNTVPQNGCAYTGSNGAEHATPVSREFAYRCARAARVVSVTYVRKGCVSNYR